MSKKKTHVKTFFMDRINNFIFFFGPNFFILSKLFFNFSVFLFLLFLSVVVLMVNFKKMSVISSKLL